MITIFHTYLFTPWPTVYGKEWTFVGSCARQKKTPTDHCYRLGWESFTELFLSNIMKYGKNDIE